jgi:PAS domain S-box-containing protein
MKSVIVGGGRRCLAFLEFLGARQLRELNIEVVCVVDTQADAPGLVFAQQQGIHTLTDYRAALSLPNVELVLELTGDKQVLTDLYNEIHHGVRIIDHDSARVFWDLIRLEHTLREELQNRSTLEKRFRQFVDSASDVISIKDSEGRYVVVNPATAALFDMEPNQLIGRSPAELYDPEVARIIGEHDAEVILNRKNGRFTERFVIDGRESYLDVTRFPLLDYQGKVDGVCVIGREVTHRFFPLIFDSISHAIFTTDAEGTITSFNRAAEEMTGYRRDEVIGRACSAIFRSDRCDRSCPLKASIHSGERAHNEEATIISKSGQSLPISVSTAALVEDGERIVGGVEMFRDLRLVSELRK